jgi:hypothetical protein
MDAKAAGVLGGCMILAALLVSPPTRTARPAPETRRYQLVRSNSTVCFLLDSKTGRLWQASVASDGKAPVNWFENTEPWLAEEK